MYVYVKSDLPSKFSNLSMQLERKSRKKKGFNGIRTRDLRETGAMLYQLSYEATHWEACGESQMSFTRNTTQARSEEGQLFLQASDVIHASK